MKFTKTPIFPGQNHSGVLVLLLFFLGSCAERKTPAPVESIYIAAKSSAAKSRSGSQIGKKPDKHNTGKSVNKPYHVISGKTYEVQKGDTLFSIAWRASIDFKELARINAIGKPWKIFPRQTIQLQQQKLQPSKITASKEVAETDAKKLNKNDAKTLAEKKRGEYRRSKSQQKPLPTAGKTQQAKTVKKQYSNKIKQWVWPTAGKVIAGFSNRENGNKGIDIGGKTGTRVVSAADGKVVYYGNALRGYGNLIIIKHNEDYLSAYAHNHRILVKEKDFVRAGQLIAEMGNTDSQNVKLHFEVRYRGKSVNPLKYLPKR